MRACSVVIARREARRRVRGGPRLALVALWAAGCGPRDEGAGAARGAGSEAGAATETAPSACVAPAAAVAVDHVVFVVGDLAAATDSFRALGFTIKPGRLHPDGLLNAHAKFVSAQEVELMSLATPPAGPIAAGYAGLLAQGEGGAYLALGTSELDEVAVVAESAGLRDRGTGPTPRFVGFGDASPAGAVFFAARSAVIDPDSLLSHANGAVGIAEVRVEGGPALADLLVRLGAVECGPVAGGGRRLGLSSGTVVLLEPPPGRRPRLLGVDLEVGGRGPPLRLGR